MANEPRQKATILDWTVAAVLTLIVLTIAANFITNLA